MAPLSSDEIIDTRGMTFMAIPPGPSILDPALDLDDDVDDYGDTDDWWDAEDDDHEPDDYAEDCYCHMCIGDGLDEDDDE